MPHTSCQTCYSPQLHNDAQHTKVISHDERAARCSPGSGRMIRVLSDHSTCLSVQLHYAVLRLLHRGKRTPQVQEVIMSIIQERQAVVVMSLHQVGFQVDAKAFIKNATIHAGPQELRYRDGQNGLCFGSTIHCCLKALIKIACTRNIALMKHQVAKGTHQSQVGLCADAACGVAASSGFSEANAIDVVCTIQSAASTLQVKALSPAERHIH